MNLRLGVVDGLEYARSGIDRDGSGQDTPLIANQLDVGDVALVHRESQQGEDVFKLERSSVGVGHRDQRRFIDIAAAHLLDGGQRHPVGRVRQGGEGLLGIDGVPRGGTFRHLSLKGGRRSVRTHARQGEDVLVRAHIVEQADLVPVDPAEMHAGQVGLGAFRTGIRSGGRIGIRSGSRLSLRPCVRGLLHFDGKTHRNSTDIQHFLILGRGRSRFYGQDIGRVHRLRFGAGDDGQDQDGQGRNNNATEDYISQPPRLFYKPAIQVMKAEGQSGQLTSAWPPVSWGLSLYLAPAAWQALTYQRLLVLYGTVVSSLE